MSDSPYRVAVLTISDRRSRGEAEDTAGPAVADLVRVRLSAETLPVEIIPDERDLIAQRLFHYCDNEPVDLILTAGGTGFAPRDVTPEATRQVVERLTPGLDEVMRSTSLGKTPMAALSRGVSGIRNRTLIVNLPGSRRAATENLEAILPVLDHGLAVLRDQSGDLHEHSHHGEM